MNKLSAVIITYNEEHNLGRCLQSLRGIADEIIIVDSFSNDKTEEIARSFGALFILNRFDGYIEQKNFALGKISNELVLSLDADETLSDELKKSILQVKDDVRADGYIMNRKTNYCGQWINHGSWYPDRKLRLFNAKKGHWDGYNPHDKVTMQDGSTTAFLKGDILHYSFYTIEEHKKQSEKFAEISAHALYKRGKRTSIAEMFLRPLFKIPRNYLFKLGFLDGYYGFVICMITVKATYLKYSILKRLTRNNT